METHLKRRAASAGAMAMVGLLSAAALAGQGSERGSPDPTQVPNVTFRVEVNYVEVDARVLDNDGRFVTDLTRDDFQVVEDGIAQTIDSFALVDIPVEAREVPAFAEAPIEADTATNARAFDGRLYLIVLDDLHISPHRTQDARRIAREFIETRLGANDRAAVFTTRGSSRASQGFTDNRQALVRAIDHFHGQKAPSQAAVSLTTPAIIVDDDDPEDDVFRPGSDPDQLQRALAASAALRTLRNAAEFMAGVHGRRKALIYISEGIDYNIYDSMTNEQATRVVDWSSDAVAAATRANVAIYSIDPRGLTPLGDGDVELASVGNDLLATDLLSEMQIAHDSMRTLSDSTGGFATLNVGKQATSFDRIVQENSSYYMLGYYPTDSTREGRTRAISVRVNRPGMQVFSRDSYVEPDRTSRPAPAATGAADEAGLSGAPSELVDSLRSPLPISGLALAGTAAPFRESRDRSSVTVILEADGDGLRFQSSDDGREHGVLDVAVVAVDGLGRQVKSEWTRTNFNLRPPTFSRVSEFGFRVLLRLDDVAPGQYQFRIGARSDGLGGAGNIGSVFYDLEIPDFSKNPLMMGGILITSPVASRRMTARPDTMPAADVLPAAPTAQRVFPPGDELALFTEIYDNDTRPHQVDIAGTILTETGELVFATSESRNSRELGEANKGYAYSARFPLTGLTPGLYVLRVEARNQLRTEEPVAKEIQFRIQAP